MRHSAQYLTPTPQREERNAPASAMNAALRTRLVDTPEFRGFCRLSQPATPSTAWVEEGLRALTHGRDCLAELNAQEIAGGTWGAWEAKTEAATTVDVRKNWPLGDTEWYSPRGNRPLKVGRTALWGALPSTKGPSSMQLGNKGHDTFTLPNLLELIEKVYSSKEEYDKRYLNAAVPKQTMDQHMQGWVEKASLSSGVDPSVVLAKVRRSIHEHKRSSSEVLVFQAIVNHEVGEEHRHVQSHLTGRLKQLVTRYVDLMKPATQQLRETFLQERLGGMVHQDEWWDVLRVLYNDSDADILKGRLHKVMMNYAPARRRVGPISVPNPDAFPGYVKYRDLSKVCQDFELEIHQRYLRRFVRLFRIFDGDSDGVLSADEFADMARVVKHDIQDALIRAYLDMADAANVQEITFTECVTCLHKELKKWLAQCPEEPEFSEVLKMIERPPGTAEKKQRRAVTHAIVF